MTSRIPYENGYYVYILKCNNNSLYTGWSVNIRERFFAHATKKGAKYTRAHLPIELYYFEVCENASTAMKREYEIKQLTRKQKEALKVKQERTK